MQPMLIADAPNAGTAQVLVAVSVLARRSAGLILVAVIGKIL